MRASSFRLLSIFLVFLNLQIYSQQKQDAEITIKDLKQDIYFLAADSLKGRYPGTKGSLEAAEFIRDQFRLAGLRLAGEDGFQEFEVVVNVKTGVNNRFVTGDINGTLDQDFRPFAYSKNGEANGPVVFAGYGLEINSDSLKWDDYKGIDVAGKWVMILRGHSESDSLTSPFNKYADERDKVLTARDKGAVGVIFVSGVRFDEKDQLVSLNYDKTQANAGLPVIDIKRTLADKIFQSSQVTVADLEKKLISSKHPASMSVPVTVDASVELVHEQVKARNVIGILEGSDPVLKNQYLVLGAHYDHLGMGGPGSGSRFLDSLAIHNGADDNASGTAGIMELAEKLASARGTLKRSLIFVAFDGEEMGILGSGYFVKNPPVALKSIDAMLNFDMIGRLNTKNHSIMVGGAGTSKESEDILKKYEDTTLLHVNFSPEGYGPSDHSSFYAENIPVFFFSSGAHMDYHTPEDDADKINYSGEKTILDYALEVIIDIANLDQQLTFQEAGPKKQERGGHRFKVTLGIMPDFTSSADNGLGVGGVNKDGPAFRGGMQKGDLITALDGKPVNNIYDYMARLKKLEPGQVISVDVIRNGEKKVLIIQL
jgi:aminopeptidase YwaD